MSHGLDWALSQRFGIWEFGVSIVWFTDGIELYDSSLRHDAHSDFLVYKDLILQTENKEFRSVNMVFRTTCHGKLLVSSTNLLSKTLPTNLLSKTLQISKMGVYKVFQMERNMATATLKHTRLKKGSTRDNINIGRMVAHQSIKKAHTCAILFPLH